MAWELLAGYLVKKGLDAVWNRAQPKAALLYAENAHRFLSKTLAEKHLRLKGDELRLFYESDEPISVTIAGQTYVLPAMMAHFPEGMGKLSDQALLLRVEGSEYTPSKALQSYVAPIHAAAASDPRLFNGKVVRLDSLQGNEGRIRPAYYYDALATNFAMDHTPSGRTESLRQNVHRGGRTMGTLEGSPLVNHIGVVGMVETCDGMLIAQHRSSKVANRPRSVSASVSGALNWTDVWHYSVADSVITTAEIVSGALRESFEELQTELDDFCYLGVLREYLRGGKPEFYFFARTPLSFAEIVSRTHTAEGRGEIKKLAGFEFHSDRVGNDDASRWDFQERVQKILTSTAADANFTFVAGTLLTADHVMRRSARLGSFADTSEQQQ